MTFILAIITALTLAPVPVYVTSIGAQNSLTDPSKDNRDTVKDLRESLSKAKEDVRLVDSPDEAQIVLTVLGRQTLDIPSSSAFGGSDSDQRRVIRVRFHTGTYDTVLEASAVLGTFGTAGGFSKAAGKIAKQVQEWIQANRDRLTPSTFLLCQDPTRDIQLFADGTSVMRCDKQGALVRTEGRDAPAR